MNSASTKMGEGVAIPAGSQVSNPPTRRSKWVTNAVLAMVTIALCLVIGEGVVRIIEPPLAMGGGDRILGNTPLRGATTTWTNFPEYNGNLVKHTNSAGFFNNDDTALEKPAGVRRIVFVGDSQTEGLCANAESYPHQLEAIANRRARGRDRYEVINGAFGGYSPYQYFLRFKRDMMPYHPDHVVVGIYVGNDIWDLTRRDDRPYLSIDGPGRITTHAPLFVDDPMRDRKLFERSRLYGLALATIGKSVSYQLTRAEKLFTNARDSGRGYGETIKYMIDVGRLSHASVNMMTQSIGQQLWFRSFPETLAPALTLNRYVMVQFQELCLREGIQLTYVFIPTKVRIEPSDIDAFATFSKHGFTPRSAGAFEDWLTDQMLADCRSLGIQTIDLRNPLEENRKGLRLYYPQDMHLNVTGNRLVGQIIADALREKL